MNMKKSLKKSEVNKKERFHDLKKFFKFYYNYSTKTILSFLLMSTIVAFDIVVQIVFLVMPSIASDPTLSLAENSLILISPLIISSTIIPIILSWNLFSRVKKDGTYVFLATKMKGRKFEFWSKFCFINMFSILFCICINIINFIFMMSMNVNIYTVFTSTLLSFFGSFIIILFFSVIGSIVCMNFEGVKSIVFSMIILIVSIVSVFTSNLAMSSKGNSLKWDGINNNLNYIKVEEIDGVGNEVSSTVGYIYSNKNKDNNTSPVEELGQSNKFGFIIDKFLLSPFNAFAQNNFSLKQEQILKLSQNSKNSLLHVFAEKNGDVSAIKDSKLLAYDLESHNPVSSSFDNEQQIFNKSFLRGDLIKRLPLDLSKEQDINILLNRLKSEKIWKRLKLSKNEKETIQELVGLRFKDNNMFYLFRDLYVLNGKYKKFLSSLEKLNPKNNLFKLIKYLWTDKIARTNILDSENIITYQELNSKSPSLQAFSGVEKATDYDIEQMKNLIINIDVNTKKIRIKMSEIWEEISVAGFPISGINSKKEWDSYIEKNSELLTLKHTYQKLNEWITNNFSKKHIYNIKFKKNVMDILSTNGQLKLILKSDSISPFLWFSIMIIMICLGAYFGQWFYKRKDVK